MDYYQGVVIDYLRADRHVFVNTECRIQLNPGPNPDITGPHWYCDAVAVDFRAETVFLCEITFSTTLRSLLKRLNEWSKDWSIVVQALKRDCHLPHWPVRPWLFLPELKVELLLKKLPNDVGAQSGMPVPRITNLEVVQPWKYCSWNRDGEPPKSPLIPPSMTC
jgi:hypothetical protein